MQCQAQRLSAPPCNTTPSSVQLSGSTPKPCIHPPPKGHLHVPKEAAVAQVHAVALHVHQAAPRDHVGEACGAQGRRSASAGRPG